MFRNSRPVLEIYSSRAVYYRFPVLIVNFGTQPYCTVQRARFRLKRNITKTQMWGKMRKICLVICCFYYNITWHFLCCLETDMHYHYNPSFIYMLTYTIHTHIHTVKIYKFTVMHWVRQQYYSRHSHHFFATLLRIFMYEHVLYYVTFLICNKRCQHKNIFSVLTCSFQSFNKEKK